MKKITKTILLLILGVFLNSALNAQVNMNRYITLSVQKQQDIELLFWADADNTPIKIVSGAQEYSFTVNAEWSLGPNNEYLSGATTMTIYGNVRKLNCKDNGWKLTGIDASHNVGLTTLICKNSDVQNLDVSQNIHLAFLDCQETKLTSLDMSNCVSLTTLVCNNSLLSSLNVAGCSLLTELVCNNNQLSSLFLSDYINLTELNCKHNQLDYLEVSGCTNLTQLNCLNNQLSSLDVSGCTSLIQLTCSGNDLNNLDVSDCLNLSSISCSDNQLSNLDVSQNVALISLYCHYNQLSNLDISQNVALKYLHCNYNQLNNLDVSQNTDLEILRCYDNPFNTEAVDVLFCSLPEREASDNAKIYILNDNTDDNYAEVIASNKQNAIDKNWNVCYFDTYSGDLHDTDIPTTTGTYDCLLDSRHISLTVQNGEDIRLKFWADADNTPVKIVSGTQEYNITVDADWTDFEKYTAEGTTMNIYGNILKFNCFNNGSKVTDIDVSHNKYLTEFYCGRNNLQGLDVSQNINLKILGCANAQLTSLNVSQNTALIDLWCNDNELSYLDVSNNAALRRLMCFHNPLNTNVVNRLFCSLPEREASDNAKIFILNDNTDDNYTDVIASNKQNAIDKNWKVWYFDNNSDIPATTGSYECDLDSRYITLLVNGASVKLRFWAEADNTPVRIVSGTEEYNIIVDAGWNDIENYSVGASTMTIYGNILKLNCSFNYGKIIDLDVSHNTALHTILCNQNTLSNLDVSACTDLNTLWCHNNRITSLDVSGCANLNELRCNDNDLVNLDISACTALTEFRCDDNQLINLDVSQNTNLEKIVCFRNPFDTEVIDALFCSLPEKDASDNAKIYILDDNTDDNYAKVIASNKQNAIDKNWNVWYYDYSGNLQDTDIPTTTGNYECEGVSVTGVTVTPAIPTILVGNTQQLTATVQPANAANQNVTWSTSDASVATVNNNGLVTGVSAGTATIAATTEDGGFIAVSVVTVETEIVSVTGVTVNPTTTTVLVANTQQLTATVVPTNATNQNVTWTSSDNSIATVGTNGLITGVSAGTATITATTDDGGFTETCVVTVETEIVSVTGVTVNPTTATVLVVNTQQLTATVVPTNATNQNVTWTSSDNSIATVGTNGLITGVSAGTATITATTDDGGFTATCVVTVENTSGISNISKDGRFTIYPNPVNEILHIEMSGNNFIIELYNIFGQKVLQTQNKRKVYMSALPSGIYLLKITTPKGVYSHKIIKD